MDASELIEKLADINPMYDMGMGDTGCFFCGYIVDNKHEDDCLWAIANKMVGKNE